MSNLPYRQVHLDFHTSECIEGIGSRFSKENFAAALKAGHVNSITLFSKCHHGWSYHPTEANEMHPHLDFDLLSAQLEVCKELGVRTEIYISAGFDEKYAVAHQDHLLRDINGNCAPFNAPCYHRICFNTPYLDVLCAQVEEVMVKFKGMFDGVFLDIIGTTPCYCEYCRKAMEEQGIDISDRNQVFGYAKQVYQKYADAMDAAVHKYDKNMPIIHNDGGRIFQGRKVAFRNTKHFELESLPTGGWGYDHFPKSAAYARTLGKEFLGMTGKFHQSWGEFGGYKHPNALRYEAALSNLCGARCSVGDQLHPDGEMDMATYNLIGKAYAEVEARESYIAGASFVADIGLVSAEACINSSYSADFNASDMIISGMPQETGANRMMLEGHYLYNIIDADEDFSKYKLLILPDNINLRGRFAQKINEYLSGGGKLLLTGRSGVGDNGDFAIDAGIHFKGECEYQPSYMTPKYELYPNGITSYVMYCKSYNIALDEAFDGEVRLECTEPYFNRTAEHFCSHRHTPYDKSKSHPVATVNGNVGYIGFEIFREYATYGSIHLKYAVFDVIDKLLSDSKTLSTSLPSAGVISLIKKDERLLTQLAYAIPKVRGNGTEIIEDIPAILDIKVSVKSDKAPNKVYFAPSMESINFTYDGENVNFTIPKFECSALVVIE